MSFLQTIFEQLREEPSKPILQEVKDVQLVSTSCEELLDNIFRARRFFRQAGLTQGDRCALLAPNSSRWVALDLAIMAEGGIAVPLYPRQSPQELVSILRDCSPRWICCSDEILAENVTSHCQPMPQTLLFNQILGDKSAHPLRGAAALHARRMAIFSDVGTPSPAEFTDDTPITLIYTSGTSGEPKGVIFSARNITFMLEQTRRRLDELMHHVGKERDERVFHYLPFCFAGSWILLLTCLSRGNCLMISTDLTNLGEELKVADPHYYLNVPALLERMRTGITAQVQQRGGVALKLFERGRLAWWRRHTGERRLVDWFWRALAGFLIFPKIRAQLGSNLQALICGSAPLAEETQLFFHMLGISVLQVYGLTETTAICTMDEVDRVIPGRVGPAIPGIEMKLGEGQEILVRGPNVFAGYWNRPEATAEIIRDGWLHTGDQGQVDDWGNWKITGRLKNLIITSGGHNVSPEPIEQMILTALPEAEQVMVIGNARKFLSAIISGKAEAERVATALKRVNQQLPHYKQVRRFYLSPELFSEENGLVTANRKLRRGIIETRYRNEIDRLYSE
jgi:long-chain acyl-CoA synthetase